MEKLRVRAVVRGRVQGVGFRASTQDEGERLGLSGWVRNLPDGSVELEAEGPRALLEALLAWCAVGPPGARVVGVEPHWLAAGEEPARDPGFVVRY